MRFRWQPPESRAWPTDRILCQTSKFQARTSAPSDVLRQLILSSQVTMLTDLLNFQDTTQAGASAHTTRGGGGQVPPPGKIFVKDAPPWRSQGGANFAPPWILKIPKNRAKCKKIALKWSKSEEKIRGSKFLPPPGHQNCPPLAKILRTPLVVPFAHW